MMEDDAQRFTRWLQVERGVIGEDVDLAALWLQYADDEPYCNHDSAALVPIMAEQCECGAVIPGEVI